MDSGSPSPILVAIDADALFGAGGPEQPPDAWGFLRRAAGNEDGILPPGPGLPLLRALLAGGEGVGHGVRVLVVSRQDAVAGLRVLASVESLALGIDRTVLTGGERCARYLRALEVDLFVTCDGEEAREASAAGTPTALVQDPRRSQGPLEQVRVVLDADGASDGELEERDAADAALEQLAGLLLRLRRAAPGTSLRVALVTSRGTRDQEHAIRSLLRSGLRVDEAFSLGGLSREAMLGAFGPHLVFEAGHRLAPSEEKPEAPAPQLPRHEEPPEPREHRRLESPLDRLRGRWDSSDA